MYKHTDPVRVPVKWAGWISTFQINPCPPFESFLFLRNGMLWNLKGYSASCISGEVKSQVGTATKD